jgi:uncharacterized protein with GYD domain
MPHYLIQASYNTSGVAGLVKQPQNRIERVTPAIEELGGQVECGYYAFGEYDVILVCELPDNVSAAAFALAVGSGGSVSSYKTTVLLTPDDATQAMSKAAESSYRPAVG